MPANDLQFPISVVAPSSGSRSNANGGNGPAVLEGAHQAVDKIVLVRMNMTEREAAVVVGLDRQIAEELVGAPIDLHQSGDGACDRPVSANKATGNRCPGRHLDGLRIRFRLAAGDDPRRTPLPSTFRSACVIGDVDVSRNSPPEIGHGNRIEESLARIR